MKGEVRTIRNTEPDEEYLKVCVIIAQAEDLLHHPIPGKLLIANCKQGKCHNVT
jgi:hypothetical protein